MLSDQSHTASVHETTKWLSAVPTRIVGSESHDRIVERLQQEIRALPNVRLWTHSFPVAMPKIEEAVLRIEQGPFTGPHRVYPIWPAGVRLNTTPKEGIGGKLIYIGQATEDQVPARSLRRQVAVMELSGGKGWRLAASLGASAIILLDDGQATQIDAATHFVALPIHVPRFYIPPGSLADALRRGDVTSGRLFATAAWVEVEATNLYALVQPKEVTEAGKALAIAAPLDSSGVVPELAPGTDAAIDAATALTLLRHLAQQPPARPVMICFLDAQSINQLGVRQMLFLVAPTTRPSRKSRAGDLELAEKYSEFVALTARIEAEGLEVLHHQKFKPLRQFVKDEVDRDVIELEFELEPLRLQRHKAPEEGQLQLQRRIDELARRRAKLRTAQAQMLTSAAIEVDMLATRLWQRVRARVEAQSRQARQRVETNEGRQALRNQIVQALHLSDPDEGPIGFLLGLDLSDAGHATGARRLCLFQRVDETRNGKAFREWLSAVEAESGEGTTDNGQRTTRESCGATPSAEP